MSTKTTPFRHAESFNPMNRRSLAGDSGEVIFATGGLSFADTNTPAGMQLNKDGARPNTTPNQYHPIKRRKTMTKKTGIIMAAMLMLGTLGAYPAVAEDGPTDLQIAHIAYTADSIDISYANLALDISDNNDVRQFAETMIRDHTAINDAALALLQELGASPEDNDTSQALLTEAEQKLSELSALSGEAFDRAYAQNELAYHQFVNDVVEGTFIPAVKNKELKALLVDALKTFKAHENHAERLVDAVN